MKKPIPPSEVDSCDSIRKAMIERRNEAMKNWPDGINDSVLFSHVIAWLGYTEQMQQYYQNDKVEKII